MEYISSENLHNGGDDGSDDALSGRCITTPQRQRRPLQQLNYPIAASPRPNVTPYKYHRCRVIPEETENDENINPSMKQTKSSGFRSRMKSNAPCPENTRKDESSPFAYPLIWETHQVVTSSPSMVSQSDPVESQCGLATRGQEGTIDKSNIPRQDMGEDVANLESKQDRGTAAEKENARGATAAAGEKGNCRSMPSTSTSSSSSKSSHSNVGSLSHFGPMVTPSKSTPTPPPSDRPIFLTPSERFKRTGDCRGAMTPQHRKPNHQVNPFEVAAECLHLPAVSPSLFRQVVSPSQKVDSNFHWSIDQLAVLHPANIETSPYNQADIQHDPDYERQAQDAIDRFFNHHSVVPSPWTGSQKSVNLLQMVCTPVHPVSSQPTPRTNTVWCQTELSIPPVLPEAVEEALKPFCTFTQDQFWQGGCEDEGTSLNNTTLRRKLLFSQDELLNATPMCSPRGADTPDPDSRPPSPSAPLPLDDEDEVPIVNEEEDHRNLLWCGTIISRGEIGASSKDPQLARHPPPTPPSRMSYLPSDKPFSEPFAFRRPGKDHGDIPMIQCSPNLSPVQAHQNNEGPVLVTSPDVSPIHCHQYITIPSPKDVFISASSHISEDTSFHDPFLGQPLSSFRVSSSQDHAVSCTETSAKDSPSCSLPFHTTLYSDSVLRNEEMLPASPSSGRLQSSYFTMRLQQSLEFSVKCQDSCSKDKNCENVHECVTGSDLCSETSHGGAIERRADKENCGDCLRTTPKIKKIPSPCRILNNIPCSDISSEINCEAPGQDHIWKQESEEKQENLMPESDENQKKTPVKTAVEQRSNSGHFSSSPIREDGNSPLAMDTPRKRFSSSPPLSPILCRSLMFLPHQDNQLRSQPKSQFSLSQSPHMSIDVDGKSCIEEEIMMDDERIGLTSSTRYVGQSLQQPRTTTTTTLRRSSSVCDMETDSLEVNVSGEVPSQDTGYVTGSLHSTNFSMSTFGNDNGTSSQIHLKDCHVNNLANTPGLSIDPYASKVVCNTEGGTIWKGSL